MAQFSEAVQKLHQQALSVISHSYSPYSKLQVACALKLKGVDQSVLGVNVENASFGATICAERSALFRAISEKGGPLEIEAVVIISSFKGDPIAPCGMCLQVLSEFAKSDMKIYLGDLNSIKKEGFFKDYLPKAFSKESLPV